VCPSIHHHLLRCPSVVTVLSARPRPKIVLPSPWVLRASSLSSVACKRNTPPGMLDLWPVGQPAPDTHMFLAHHRWVLLSDYSQHTSPSTAACVHDAVIRLPYTCKRTFRRVAALVISVTADRWILRYQNIVVLATQLSTDRANHVTPP
jgi:hypothetical protein